MVSREQMLEDIKEAGECDYCKHQGEEQQYWDGAQKCMGDCLNCDITACACNGCINFSHWEYCRE